MKKVSFSDAIIRLRHPLPVRFIVGLLCLASIVYAGQAQAQKKATPAPAIQQAAPAFTYKIISAANGTYGYDIYADGKLRIHQPAIPAIPGNEGFKTKAAAEKVANLAISKMKKGESLPTISPEELKKLKAI